MRSRTNALVSIMCVVVCGLIVIFLVSQTLRVLGGHGNQLGFERVFNLDRENNIPSWYASTSLFFCSTLLGLIGVAKRREAAPYSGHWLVLSAIFLYISADEAASLHEMTIPFARSLIERAGLFTEYLYYSWVVFGTAAVAILGLSYARFLGVLPSTTRRGFILAGVIYVTGAIGMELLGGRIDYLGEVRSMPYAIVVAAEEGLEMFGVVMLVYTLLSYMNREDVARSLLRLHGEMAGGSATGPRPSPEGERRESNGSVSVG